ncbi:MAG: hypothetical protein ABI780_01470 [Ardenticatenales bacterium]
MRDALEFVLPATFGLLFFGVFFGFLGWLRWMRFREMLALADRGYLPADAPNGTNRMLRWSLILIAIGLALSCGILPVAFDSVHAFPALIPGLTMLFVGLAFLLYWLLTGGRDLLAARGNSLPIIRPRPPAAFAPSGPSGDVAFSAADDGPRADANGLDDDMPAGGEDGERTDDRPMR